MAPRASPLTVLAPAANVRGRALSRDGRFVAELREDGVALVIELATREESDQPMCGRVRSIGGYGTINRTCERVGAEHLVIAPDNQAAQTIVRFESDVEYYYGGGRSRRDVSPATISPPAARSTHSPPQLRCRR